MKKIGVLFLVLGFLVGLWILGVQGVSKKTGPQPTLTPTEPAPKKEKVSSVDGTKQLIMRVIPQLDDAYKYDFVVIESEKETSIFQRVSTSDAFTIPGNSWSPDGNYIFVVQTNTNPQTVFVAKANGETFDGFRERSLDVTYLFKKMETKYTFSEATGWDSRGLLAIRTKNEDNTKGPSYWFDVDSRSFIELPAR